MKHSHHSHHSDYSHHLPQANSADGQPWAKAKPSPDEVARKAYEIYLSEGCPQGRDVQHWLQAESQLSV
jgi:hypothetical protein